MIAAILRHYGGPDAIDIADVAAPIAGPDDLLVQVHAASVNPIDWKIARGKTKLILKTVFPQILGCDFSGEVIAIGKNVSGYALGDAVYGRVDKERMGTFAEQLAIEASLVDKKPASLSHVEATALPLVGLTSWQVLSELGQLQPSQKVLIHAGAGGIGTIAIQLAKALGAHVITTASAANHALVQSLGADEVIDYRTRDFSQAISGVDLVYDTIGGDTLKQSFRVVKPGGQIISIAHLPTPESVANLNVSLPVRLLLGLLNRPIRRLAKQTGVAYRYWFMRPDGTQMKQLSTLVQTGQLKPIIDRTYPLTQTAEAFRYLETGRARGKVIIEIAP